MPSFLSSDKVLPHLLNNSCKQNDSDKQIGLVVESDDNSINNFTMI
ncbi:hypothetical protein CAXC1_300035 [Candidatus Xenohaliotis californiensis]|uniref:Uncharacterized protein n=1 Tax=Candidatus Xenohaliotis californiensis TaxID=84677 RepID=A0ABM9N892_9RICK|nr:hypothetical protein CAXC1_300035 [Candidatus Xenohaliotis californiensis]